MRAADLNDEKAAARHPQRIIAVQQNLAAHRKNHAMCSFAYLRFAENDMAFFTERKMAGIQVNL